ncbi:uncharacterized protein LOC129576740 isoform X2 [Sitodiplosis mosellana]|uniref:uncharacterized protein LOC129576740 isoform X2 n=1 Tax=Sitodiplosis mosellana TaxID=263140 RepID=UPI0024444023|nr:uncharacterized protein LOC129576740 isoform X2 [Sitodiplosis mosellana]
MNWGFSSSSESDSDEDRPVSKFRTDTLFYQQYQRGEYGDDWPIELLGHTSNHRLPNNHLANSSILFEGNGHANTSFANLSRIVGLDESRILSPASILPADDIVFVNDGGKYRPIRVISKTEILPPRKTPDDKAQAKKLKSEPSDEGQKPDATHVPREIPLDLVDYVDRPKDPRNPEPEYFCDGLVIPRFWRETVLRSEMDKNRDRLNGSYKRSNSLVRERTLQRTQRLGMLGARRDPRLDRSLFANPPRKIASPAKAHNQSHPNVASGSIFDCEDATEDVSSVASAFSSSSGSLGSLPSAGDDHFHNSTKVTNNGHHDDFDSVSGSDDNDCSFTAFQKRKLGKKTKRAAKRTKHSESTSTNDDDHRYIPPIKIDLKKKKVTPTSDKKKKFSVPDVIDKEIILKALADEEASEDQENVCTNTRKIQTRASTNKNTKNVKMTPISGYNLKKPNGACVVSSSSSTNSLESKTNIVKIEKVEASLAKVNALKREKPNVQILSGIEPLNTVVPDKEPVPSVSHQQHNETELSEKSSIGSTSIGSIEQRLAEMTSPVRTAADVLAEQNEQQLTDILTDGNDDATTHMITQRDDNQLGDTAAEPMIVAEPMILATEDSGIQTAAESPPENHSDSVEAIQSDGSYKKDQDNSSNACDIHDSKIVQHTNVNEIKPKTIVEASVSDTVPHQMPIDTEPEHAVEQPAIGCDDSAEMDIITANLSFGSPEVGANVDLGISHIAEYAKNLLDSSAMMDDVDVGTLIVSNSPAKDGAKKLKKPERTQIILSDFSENGNVAATQPYMKLATSTSDDVDISDDDYEDDTPCGINELTLPNSNTDRNANDAMKSNCNLCSYQADKGWKQLTKHYVRKHPGKEISISRLANNFNPQELQSPKFTPLITKGCEGTMIQSMCYICDKGYNMCSAKWMQHFIAHTGEFEFRCNKCGKEIMQDLHKQCNSKENERINGPFDFVDNVLYGYVCGLCSYVQLSETNITTHLKEEHQQLITGNENVIEITLLKITQPGCLDFFNDDKNDAALVEAKERLSATHHPSRYQPFSPVVISDGDDESSNDGPQTHTIDLTLSDEEI